MNAIAQHCRELDRCNQRGGRMLSVADLIAADTMPVALAAALVARIAGGASFMIGAQPGGAGKTTVMCALLNFIPADAAIRPATRDVVCQAAEKTQQRCCYVCHEIGAGPYYAYLWDDPLRQYCLLGENGHILATNLHADTLEEAHEQVCGANRVPEKHFRHFSVLVFLRVQGASRIVHQVYASNGGSPHALAYDHPSGIFAPDLLAAPEKRDAWHTFLDRFMAQPDHTIQAMRKAVLTTMPSPELPRM